MQELQLQVKCFNLKYTLECGQCFRWEKLSDEKDTYVGVIFDRVLKVRQIGDNLYIRSSKAENLENVVKKYFDLDNDYKVIEERISKIDTNVNKAVKNTSGIRHLNQDFFETLISYIISANNNIPRISKSVKEISKRYGKKIIFDEKEYYLFPTPEELKNVSKEEYRSCGVGFRDGYIQNTVKEILDGKIDFEKVDNMTTEELRKLLLSFKGVGPKVADCILLFACNRQEVFPIDVWVERVMSVLYFKEAKGSMSKKEILKYADEKFGNDAGIIQQHLFYNMREGMM